MLSSLRVFVASSLKFSVPAYFFGHQVFEERRDVDLRMQEQAAAAEATSLTIKQLQVPSAFFSFPLILFPTYSLLGGSCSLTLTASR
jgi:hypothetical protein